MGRQMRPAVGALSEVLGPPEVRISDVGWLWLRLGVRLALAVERERLRLRLAEHAFALWEETEIQRAALRASLPATGAAGGRSP